MGKPKISVTNRALLFMWNNGSDNMDGYGADFIGGHLWPDRTTRIAASTGGGDYAAQMLLGRMKKVGLVRVRNGPGSSRWELTATGNQRAARLAQDASR